MGKGRFLYHDYDPAIADFAVSSVRDGQVGLAIKTGSGSATGLAGGAYTGLADRQYRVEIESIAGGAAVGQATFRWRDGTVAGWNGSGVLTSNAPVALNNGVTFEWTSGVGADFVVGDRWDFTVASFYGIRQLLDRDRDTAFRTKQLDSPNTIRRDLGAARQVTACVIADHNLTSGASITLKGHTADAWGAPDYALAIPWASEIIVAYLDQTYRYWRLEITDAGNPDGCIEIGEWFLGTYWEPSTNYSRDWAQDGKLTETLVRTDAGARRHLVQSRADDFRLRYELQPAQSAADLAGFLALEAAVHDVPNLRGRPFWFHRDSDLADGIHLVTLQGGIRRRSPFLHQYLLDLVLEGVPKTVA